MHFLNTMGERIASFFSEPELHIEGKTNLRGIPEIFQQDTFAEHLPYLSYDEPTGIFINKDSVGFAIEAVPLVGCDTAAEKEIQELFYEHLDEGDSLQFLLWADHRIDPILQRWQAKESTSHGVIAELAKKRREFFSNGDRVSSRHFRFILSYSSPSKEDEVNAKLKRLEEKKNSILKSLKAITLAWFLDANRFMKTIDGMLCFCPSAEVRDLEWNPLQPLSSQFTKGGKVRVKKEGLEWDNEKTSSFQSFRVTMFPPSWSLEAMHLLIGDVVRESYRISNPFFLHYGVHCPSQSHEESRFWKRSQLIENQGKSGMLLRMVPNLEAELKECDAIRRSVNKGARFVWTQFSAGIWAPQEKISQSAQTLKSLFRINQFTLQENNYLHLPQFLATLPMTWSQYVEGLKALNILKTTITPECTHLVPIQGEWIGTKSPGILLTGRRGQLLNWNPFDNKSGNYNVSVVGRSGSGKSVFMQDLLLSGLRTGTKVFVLEVGRSFEKMADLLDAQQIQFSQSSDICLNPFTDLSQEKEEREEGITMIKSIVACMASPNKGVSDFELAMIEKAIRQAWNIEHNNATISTVASWLQKQQDERAKSLGVMLTPYTKEGVYGKHFEGSNNVNFHNPLVLVELEELKEKKDLQSVVIQVFIMSITNQAFLGDRTTPFFICIDEAWDLLRGPQTGVFIETLARRLRKYNGSLVVGTQSIDDFFATPGAKAAFENSDWLCMLSQKKGSLSLLFESGKLDFDESKRKAIESLHTRHGEYSEVAIFDGDGNYSIARLILDPFSQLLYSTNAQEYAQIKKFQQKGMTIAEAINNVLGGNHV